MRVCACVYAGGVCVCVCVYVGNPELYDPTDTCRPTSRPTVGRLTGDSRATNGRQFYKWCRPTVARLSGKCWFSVGQVSVVVYHFKKIREN